MRNALVALDGGEHAEIAGIDASAVPRAAAYGTGGKRRRASASPRLFEGYDRAAT
jgi:hypothetical protein